MTSNGETVAQTEQHPKKLQVCENNWVRRIIGAKTVDRLRMDDLREEIGMQFSLTRRTVRSQIDVSRQLGADGGGLVQKADAMKLQGSR